MLLLAYRHGLRVSELVALRWEQVDLQGGVLRVRRRKDGLTTTHPLYGFTGGLGGTSAGLAFLGFGQAPPAANWGLMINENRSGLPLNPWAVIVPAALIALLTIVMWGIERERLRPGADTLHRSGEDRAGEARAGSKGNRQAESVTPAVGRKPC